MITTAIFAGMPLLILFALALGCDAWSHWKYHCELNWRLGDFWYELPLTLFLIAAILFQCWAVVSIN